MSQYLLLNHVKVQNANAIAGLTWGFPAITHFLGFSHNLNRKLQNNQIYQDIVLTGCAVIAHQYHVHSYKTSNGICFSQNKTPHYLESIKKVQLLKAPSVIEEGKMNMTVSLLIQLDGYLGNLQEGFLNWISKISLGQRLAGGTILNIGAVEVVDIGDVVNLRSLKRKLLPGFVLRDRSHYLEHHLKKLRILNPGAELLDAWLDFSSIKQKARPRSDLISKHFVKQFKDELDNSLLNSWEKHKAQPYDEQNIPGELNEYFSSLNADLHESLIKQWQEYCAPTDNIDANWEYVGKPAKGYLVPIMTGYKALTKVYQNHEVESTRDFETDVCFVEAVHSIGEWLSVHRLKTFEDLQKTIWQYAPYEVGWYLCQQGIKHELPPQKTSVSDYE
jgi:CRISPR-associated protein Csy2